jgi:hypothetical protein
MSEHKWAPHNWQWALEAAVDVTVAFAGSTENGKYATSVELLENTYNKIREIQKKENG